MKYWLYKNAEAGQLLGSAFNFWNTNYFICNYSKAIKIWIIIFNLKHFSMLKG